MRINLHPLLACSAALVAGALWAFPALAAEQKAHKFGDIKSMNVENDKGEKLGKVSDMVYDPRSGNIKYAVLEFGGFLGVGEKLFAVPWYALKPSFDSVNNRYRLLMNADRQSLSKSPGFNKANWPNVADPQWSSEVDKFYPNQAAQEATASSPGARASDLVGMNVKNSQGENLGEINEVVLDVPQGSIRYVAVAFGGVLGFGDKLFAVPFESLGAAKPANSDKYHIVLNVDKDSLKQAPGFDKNHWPDFADANWARDVDRHYRRDPQRRATATTSAFKSSGLIGMRVENDRNEDLGKVNDLVIDSKSGKIRYAAISFGGFLGVGDKLFAVPWQALKVRYDSEAQENRVVMNVDKASLEKAPGFDSSHWPNFADTQWSTSVNDYYGVKVDPSAADVQTMGLRISQVVGMAAQNEQGEKLGKIDEVVFDLPGGAVRYAAMSFGGFLGIGDKLFAIPWRQVDIRSQDNGKSYLAVVNADKKALEKAPSFDKNHWPDFGDPNWSREIDQYYRVDAGRPNPVSGR